MSEKKKFPEITKNDFLEIYINTKRDPDVVYTWLIAEDLRYEVANFLYLEMMESQFGITKDMTKKMIEGNWTKQMEEMLSGYGYEIFGYPIRYSVDAVGIDLIEEKWF